MPDTEFDASLAGLAAPAPDALTIAPPPHAPAAPTERPRFIPEKFWDSAEGRVRVEELAKSYRALERKLARDAETRRAASPGTSPQPTDAVPPRDSDPAEAPPGAPLSATEAPATVALDTSVPASPADYAVRVSHPWLERDVEIDGLLHAAGFNQAQAQLLYDLAAERVIPVIERMARNYEQQLAQGQIEAHFGGPERFGAIARQVRAWGERNLPKPLFETLTASPDGVVALHHMMRAGEPRFVAGEAPAAGPNQAELEGLVRDPRYWRDHDPQLVKRVEEGFRRLYPGE